MANKTKTKCIGILTSGGDCPGLNAAIRGVVKAAIGEYGIKVIGFYDGFRGLCENRFTTLESGTVSGILTHGGTILGTSRDKPHKMNMGGKIMDMTDTAVQNAKKLGIECLVCLGGGGTQKNALNIVKAGLPVITLPKTIDNDVPATDTTFGFDTAMSIATEAIDRLHTTATSHHRMIICEVMGHRVGWLALGAGIAGGADVILIPEIPYNINTVAAHLLERRRSGKRFSIIALAEGAISVEEAKKQEKEGKKKKKNGNDISSDIKPHQVEEPKASRLAREIQHKTGFDVRLTSLGHVQRGGIPTPTDRLLCSRLGTKAAELLAKGIYNVMVAVKGNDCIPVPLKKIAGEIKTVPLDHEWIKTARLIGTCIGDTFSHI
jgi:6-phosphofructokinase 1